MSSEKEVTGSASVYTFFSEKSAMFQRWPNIDKGRKNETVRYLSPSSNAILLLDSGFG